MQYYCLPSGYLLYSLYVREQSFLISGGENLLITESLRINKYFVKHGYTPQIWSFWGYHL